MEQLIQQQHEANLQGDFRLVWVCQQKINYIKEKKYPKMWVTFSKL